MPPMKPDTYFDNPVHPVSLKLWPRLNGEKLRAWDGADLLLLEHIAEQDASTEQDAADQPATLVLNDPNGALTLPLLAAGVKVHASGDSWLAQKALLTNAEDNDLATDTLSWSWPDEEVAQPIARVLIRLPKSLSLFESQLATIAGTLPEGTQVIVSSMDKHTPPSVMKILEKYFLSVEHGLGRRKAHLYFAQLGHQTAQQRTAPAVFAIPALQGKEICAQPGTFSGDKLDIGARFFSEHVPSDVAGNIADLGCGNGVIGLVALDRNPEASVWFCDESAQAVSSAKTNTAALYPKRECSFHHGNGLDGLAETFSLILLNPPFHRGHAVDEGVSSMLFKHARRHLNSDGELYVIGNRHLKYNLPLRKLFGSVREVAANDKFTIWAAKF
tara:strand:- start:31357 stop:32517 length:1161 start_codon:yes stop_codon:yes gene_type:complete